MSDNLPLVLSDETHLRQVFLNLIGNAIKFTPDGGLVDIRSAAPSDGTLGGALVISVADSGIGIPREKIGELSAPLPNSRAATAEAMAASASAWSTPSASSRPMAARSGSTASAVPAPSPMSAFPSLA